MQRWKATGPLYYIPGAKFSPVAYKEGTKRKKVNKGMKGRSDGTIYVLVPICLAPASRKSSPNSSTPFDP
jgi:hypothetical protein